MPRVIFIEHSGITHEVEAAPGDTLMHCALDNLVPGIVGDCGGCCACATCHGYIDERWQGAVTPSGEDERMMLEGAIDPRPNSRLTCQITLTADLDGIIVRLPASQN